MLLLRSNKFFATYFRESVLELYQNSQLEIDLNVLEAYLIQNNLILYAPYFSENFGVTDMPITVSWFDNSHTDGNTEGIIQHIGGRAEFLAVDDVYAFSNPTVVLMWNDMFCDLDCIGFAKGMGTGNSTAIPYTARSTDCRQLTAEDKISLQMPEFRLLGNLKAWPLRNKLYLWVVYGEFTQNNQGEVEPSAHVVKMWDELVVSRKNAREKKWLSTGLTNIIDEFQSTQTEFTLVLGYKKGNDKISFNGLISIDASNHNQPTHNARYEIKKDRSRLHFDVTFDRFVVLAQHGQDLGYGIRNDLGVYRFNQFEFLLNPVLID